MDESQISSINSITEITRVQKFQLSSEETSLLYINLQNDMYFTHCYDYKNCLLYYSCPKKKLPKVPSLSFVYVEENHFFLQ